MEYINIFKATAIASPLAFLLFSCYIPIKVMEIKQKNVIDTESKNEQAFGSMPIEYKPKDTQKHEPKGKQKNENIVENPILKNYENGLEAKTNKTANGAQNSIVYETNKKTEIVDITKQQKIDEIFLKITNCNGITITIHSNIEDKIKMLVSFARCISHDKACNTPFLKLLKDYLLHQYKNMCSHQYKAEDPKNVNSPYVMCFLVQNGGALSNLIDRNVKDLFYKKFDSMPGVKYTLCIRNYNSKNPNPGGNAFTMPNNTQNHNKIPNTSVCNAQPSLSSVGAYRSYQQTRSNMKPNGSLPSKYTTNMFNSSKDNNIYKENKKATGQIHTLNSYNNIPGDVNANSVYMNYARKRPYLIRPMNRKKENNSYNPNVPIQNRHEKMFESRNELGVQDMDLNCNTAQSHNKEDKMKTDVFCKPESDESKKAAQDFSDVNKVKSDLENDQSTDSGCLSQNCNDDEEKSNPEDDQATDKTECTLQNCDGENKEETDSNKYEIDLEIQVPLGVEELSKKLDDAEHEQQTEPYGGIANSFEKKDKEENNDEEVQETVPENTLRNFDAKIGDFIDEKENTGLNLSQDTKQKFEESNGAACKIKDEITTEQTCNTTQKDGKISDNDEATLVAATDLTHKEAGTCVSTNQEQTKECTNPSLEPGTDEATSTACPSKISTESDIINLGQQALLDEITIDQREPEANVNPVDQPLEYKAITKTENKTSDTSETSINRKKNIKDTEDVLVNKIQDPRYDSSKDEEHKKNNEVIRLDDRQTLHDKFEANKSIVKAEHDANLKAGDNVSVPNEDIMAKCQIEIQKKEQLINNGGDGIIPYPEEGLIAEIEQKEAEMQQKNMDSYTSKIAQDDLLIPENVLEQHNGIITESKEDIIKDEQLLKEDLIIKQNIDHTNDCTVTPFEESLLSLEENNTTNEDIKNTEPTVSELNATMVKENPYITLQMKNFFDLLDRIMEDYSFINNNAPDSEVKMTKTDPSQPSFISLIESRDKPIGMEVDETLAIKKRILSALYIINNTTTDDNLSNETLQTADNVTAVSNSHTNPTIILEIIKKNSILSLRTTCEGIENDQNNTKTGKWDDNNKTLLQKNTSEYIPLYDNSDEIPMQETEITHVDINPTTDKPDVKHVKIEPFCRYLMIDTGICQKIAMMNDQVTISNISISEVSHKVLCDISLRIIYANRDQFKDIFDNTQSFKNDKTNSNELDDKYKKEFPDLPLFAAIYLEKLVVIEVNKSIVLYACYYKVNKESPRRKVLLYFIQISKSKDIYVNIDEDDVNKLKPKLMEIDEQFSDENLIAFVTKCLNSDHTLNEKSSSIVEHTCSGKGLERVNVDFDDKWIFDEKHKKICAKYGVGYCNSTYSDNNGVWLTDEKLKQWYDECGVGDYYYGEENDFEEWSVCEIDDSDNISISEFDDDPYIYDDDVV